MNQTIPFKFKELYAPQVREYALAYETQHPGAHPTFYPAEGVRQGFKDLMEAHARQIHDLVEDHQRDISRCHTSLESRDRLIIEQRDQLDELRIALDRVTAERDGNQTCINALREKLAALEKARRPVPHYKIWRVPAPDKKGGPNKARPICMAIVASEVDADILVDLYNNSYNDVFYYTPEAMNGTT